MTLLGANGRPLKSEKPKPQPQGDPIIETTHAENLAIRKFLNFAVRDVRYQLDMMSKDTKVSRETFETAKDTALILSQYMIAQIRELDRLIATVEPNTQAADLAVAQTVSAAVN